MNLKHHQTFESLMEGYTPSLFEVLEDREARVHKQNQLMQHNPQATVVVLKVNMPGPVKVNQITKELLLIGAQSILESLNEKNYDVIYFLVCCSCTCWLVTLLSRFESMIQRILHATKHFWVQCLELQ